MRRVILVDYDYDSVNQLEWFENTPAILIDDFTLMSKSSETLDIYRSEIPIKVEADESVNCRELFAIEIELNADGLTLDIKDIATMTVARLTKFMRIER